MHNLEGSRCFTHLGACYPYWVVLIKEYLEFQVCGLSLAQPGPALMAKPIWSVNGGDLFVSVSLCLSLPFTWDENLGNKILKSKVSVNFIVMSYTIDCFSLLVKCHCILFSISYLAIH